MHTQMKGFMKTKSKKKLNQNQIEIKKIPAKNKKKTHLAPFIYNRTSLTRTPMDC